MFLTIGKVTFGLSWYWKGLSIKRHNDYQGNQIQINLGFFSIDIN